MEKWVKRRTKNCRKISLLMRPEVGIIVPEARHYGLKVNGDGHKYEANMFLGTEK